MTEVVVTIIALFVVLAGGACWAATQCHDRGEKMGLPVEYGLSTGCMVKVEGRWIPIDSYRVVD